MPNSNLAGHPVFLFTISGIPTPISLLLPKFGEGGDVLEVFQNPAQSTSLDLLLGEGDRWGQNLFPEIACLSSPGEDPLF